MVVALASDLAAQSVSEWPTGALLGHPNYFDNVCLEAPDSDVGVLF